LRLEICSSPGKVRCRPQGDFEKTSLVEEDEHVLQANQSEVLMQDPLPLLTDLLRPTALETQTEIVVAVVGLGYVGLPTALTIGSSGAHIIGIDLSEARLDAIRQCRVDVTPRDLRVLAGLLDSPGFLLDTDATLIQHADAVIVAVPTPVDKHLEPDLHMLRCACATVVENAQPGQTIIVTSTSYVGTTRDLVVRPLEQRGFRVGEDIFVAFSPERIDPGRTSHRQEDVPRVVGGVTPACTARAAAVVQRCASSVHCMDSAEAAELTKLYENTFRAVNIAFANEMAEVSRALGLDVMQIIEAASTKPYGFMPFYPGPGVGGHCIPCDPHYLLWQLREEHTYLPVIEQAMSANARRPKSVVQRAIELLAEAGCAVRGARVLLVGVSYKPGLEDVRESPALEIIQGLRDRGVNVAFNDSFVSSLQLEDGTVLSSVETGSAAQYDLVVVHTLHPGVDHSWIASCPNVLDASYRLPRELGCASL
jgi:nucleotide sugar dehydrogenase